jgi:3-oxoadipate enol-lactonase
LSNTAAGAVQRQPRAPCSISRSQAHRPTSDDTLPRMPTVELGEATLFYELAGSGPPVLSISGSGGDLRNPPGPFAWPGAEGFSLLAFDHRDLGRSVSRSREQPTMGDFARDALALVDHVGWERFSVFGLSFGGMVAQELALAAGDRVECLVLAATSAGGRCGASYPLHELYELTPEQRGERLVTLLDTRAASDAALAQAIAGYLTVDHSFATGEAAPAGLLRQLEARRRHDTCERLGALRAPTLVAAGSFDGIAPVDNSNALAQQIPDAHVRVFDGGHGFLLQDPRAWPELAGTQRAGHESARASA